VTLVLAVAREVLREASRRRLLLALLLLTLAVIALTGWGFSRIPTLRDNGQPMPEAQMKAIASQLLILVMFMFSFVLSLAAVFVAAPSISGEIESGVALALLSRPISRTEYALGKWLGLAVVVAIYATAASAVELAVVGAVTGYTPPHPAEFVLFIVGEGVVILTLALALSTRLSAMVAGVVSAVVFGMAWMAGVAGTIGAFFHNDALVRAETVSKLLLPTDGLWRGAVFSLEPAAVLAAAGSSAGFAANPFAALSPPPLPYLVWVGVWLVAVLALGIWSLERREL
jgi:ABC-2 type transport system permease protein